MNKFPRLCEKALSTLIPFATTYLCDTAFSALLSIKTKFRNRHRQTCELLSATVLKKTCAIKRKKRVFNFRVN